MWPANSGILRKIRKIWKTEAAETQAFRYRSGMESIETLRQDVRDGRVSAERLIDLMATLQRLFQATQQQLEATQQQLEAANKRIEELEKKLGGPPSTKLDQPYSMRSEEQRQEAQAKKKRKRKGRGGRRKTIEKIVVAARTEAVYPEGSLPSDCYLSHTRPVWRLEQDRAVLIAYEVYRNSKGQYGRIPGVLGRSEFGLEIVTEIAHLVYAVGLSFDKVCQVLHFFQHLKLTKSHVDALLYRLSRHWERQFEVLCVLLANSLVVNADETSWSIKSVWAFLSEKARVLLFGVNKDAETLQKILDPATFAGLVVSDDAAVYASFNKQQKCWAHLLRKAIKLALQDEAKYRSFADRLLEIYWKACRVQQDGRLADAGRAQKVSELEMEIFELCGPTWNQNLPKQQGLADDHRLLVEELMRLALAEQLFPFVTAKAVVQPNSVAEKPVSGTNNEAERTLRGPAQCRDTGRTNKTGKGARRQTVLTSVLESLRLYLPTYTLATVIEEVKRWCQGGRSCFEELLKQLGLKLPQSKPSTLDCLFPNPSPEPATKPEPVPIPTG
jgi:transposase